VEFRFYAFRFTFRAVDPIAFPLGSAGNVLRGALGTTFQKLCCSEDCPGARTCERRAACPYARLFEPVALRHAPSGLRDHPRPFVIRAASLDGLKIRAGESFTFDVHIFDLAEPAVVYFATSFAELARTGLGPGRGRVDLIGIEQLGVQPSQVGQADGLRRAASPPLVSSFLHSAAGSQPAFASSIISLDPESPVTLLTVRFKTPTELKAGGEIVGRPEFSVLFARARDRVSSLMSLYGAGAPAIDFAALGERARLVRMTRCEIRHESVSRRSSKTGQRHALGGFVGEAEYAGELSDFYPWLRAAEWTGVGRQTVWGKGVIECIPAPAYPAEIAS
jgi:hypothetical protein